MYYILEVICPTLLTRTQLVKYSGNNSELNLLYFSHIKDTLKCNQFYILCISA